MGFLISLCVLRLLLNNFVAAEQTTTVTPSVSDNFVAAEQTTTVTPSVSVLPTEEAANVSASVCGRPVVNSGIYWNSNATAGSWPWQASIHNGGSHMCGGSLINTEWVLSAARCFISNDTANLTVYLGREYQEQNNPNEVSRGVIYMTIHAGYSPWSHDNDIALLRLDSPVTFTDFIKPVCLAASGITFYNGTELWVTGWGNINSGVPLPYPQTLQQAEIPVVGNNQCNCIYGPTNITDNMMCAGQDSCQGDYGGPLVVFKDPVWVQAGIVSFGEGCAASGYPKVYTRVSRYQEWILSFIIYDPPGFITYDSNGTDSDSNFDCTGPIPSAAPPPPRPLYPFGFINGDSEISQDPQTIYLYGFFPFFGGGGYYVNVYRNGFLTFDSSSVQSDSVVHFPSYSRFDIIAPFWTSLNAYNGIVYYRVVYSGSLLQQATADVNQYFPGLLFNATTVIIVTWDRVPYSGMPDSANTFQAVLITNGTGSFVLFNYGDLSPAPERFQAGYDTQNSMNSYSIPGSFESEFKDLKFTSNVNVNGCWAFQVDTCFSSCQFTGHFYPYGQANGDTVSEVTSDGGPIQIQLNETFQFFRQGYNQLYLYFNGLVSFDTLISNYYPYGIPSKSAHDIIAPYWTYNFYYYYYYYYSSYYGYPPPGYLSYRQATDGSTLERATADINQYFPEDSFNATSVFIATWDRDYLGTWWSWNGRQANTFQLVLITNGTQSYMMMNYGRLSSYSWWEQVGYDTKASRNYYHIPYNSPSDLSFNSNVNVTGRWAFSAKETCPDVYVVGGKVHIRSATYIDSNTLQQMLYRTLGITPPQYTCPV